jgi:hypothetical protein
MTDWVPKESILTEERYWLLEFIKLYKREQADNGAMIGALQMAGHQGHLACADLMLGLKEEGMESAERHVEVLFRPLVLALNDGSDYLAPLREFVQRRQ